MSLIQAASDVQEQGAVDDRDSFLHGVRDLLSIHSSSQHYHFTNCSLLSDIFQADDFLSIPVIDVQAGLSTYVSAPAIIQQIVSLQSDLSSLQSDLENSLPDDRNRCINEL